MTCLSRQIKGHDKIQNQLISAIRRRRLPHGLLFSGPGGVGKKKTAWALAQNLLCQQKALPACGSCLVCRRTAKQISESVFFIAPKTLQIKIDEAREIQKFLALQTSARAKIVILDEADRLNIQAANSLLKIVEEPPLKSFFFFISSSPNRLPLTLRSRLQNIRFKELSFEVVRSLLSEEDEWPALAGGGRMDIIESLKGKKDLRDLSFALWKKISTQGEPPFAIAFPPELKDRTQALFVSQIWQWILRDARIGKAGLRGGFICKDQPELRKELEKLPANVLDFLFQQALVLERDLRAYMDSAICFEHFALSLQKFAGEKEQVCV